MSLQNESKLGKHHNNGQGKFDIKLNSLLITKKEDFLSDAATQESCLPAASDYVNTHFCFDSILRAETSILRSPGGNFVQLCC